MHTAAEHMQRSDPPADNCARPLPSPGADSRSLARSLPLASAALTGGLSATSRVAPTDLKPHLLQYVQECASQFSGRVSCATFVRGLAPARLLFFLAAAPFSFSVYHLLGFTRQVSCHNPTLSYYMIEPSVEQTEMTGSILPRTHQRNKYLRRKWSECKTCQKIALVSLSSAVSAIG